MEARADTLLDAFGAGSSWGSPITSVHKGSANRCGTGVDSWNTFSDLVFSATGDRRGPEVSPKCRPCCGAQPFRRADRGRGRGSQQVSHGGIRHRELRRVPSVQQTMEIGVKTASRARTRQSRKDSNTCVSWENVVEAQTRRERSSRIPSMIGRTWFILDRGRCVKGNPPTAVVCFQHAVDVGRL